MDGVSEARLELVNPVLAAKIRELAGTSPFPIRVVQGLRTFAEQDALYAQGRTAPGLRVTAARAGYSYHNVGLAVDVVPMINGLPDWRPGHFTEIIAAAEALGLVSGQSWNDLPHLQLTGIFPVTPDDVVRSLFASSGVQGVWTAANLDSTEVKNA